jgi:hypothetical protein
MTSDAATMAGMSAMKGKALKTMDWEKYKDAGRTEQLDMHIAQLSTLDKDSQKLYRTRHGLEGLEGMDYNRYLTNKKTVDLPDRETVYDQTDTRERARREHKKMMAAIVAEGGEKGIRASIAAEAAATGDPVQIAAAAVMLAKDTGVIDLYREWTGKVPPTEEDKKEVTGKVERLSEVTASEDDVPVGHKLQKKKKAGTSFKSYAPDVPESTIDHSNVDHTGEDSSLAPSPYPNVPESTINHDMVPDRTVEVSNRKGLSVEAPRVIEVNLTGEVKNVDTEMTVTEDGIPTTQDKHM